MVMELTVGSLSKAASIRRRWGVPNDRVSIRLSGHTRIKLPESAMYASVVPLARCRLSVTGHPISDGSR